MQQTNSSIHTGASIGRMAAELDQLSTFRVDNEIYGIDVTRVQEVVRSMPMTPVPLAPPYVRGLINLRGQVTTAIGLRELFDIKTKAPDQFINVVCRLDGILISLQVDEIGDVIEIPKSEFETTPQTVPHNVRKFMEGVYKLPTTLLSIINIDKISEFLNKQNNE